MIGACLVTAALQAACSMAPTPNPSTQFVSASAEGAELWATTCNGCHTFRPPAEYSADEWSVIVSHMRTRAGLTRSEAGAIAAYLRERSGDRGGAR